MNVNPVSGTPAAPGSEAPRESSAAARRPASEPPVPRADGGEPGEETDVRVLTWALALVLVFGLGVTGWAIHRHQSRERAAHRERFLADFRLLERSGRTVTRADLAPYDLVVNFVHSSCSVSCLQVNQHLAEVQRLLAAQGRTDVRLVSLTVDPRTDTPPVLADFARRFGADAERWLFLTGEPAAVDALVETSFLDRGEAPYGDTFPGGFAGTDRIAIVDRQGRVREFIPGTGADAPRKVIEALDRLRAGGRP